VTGEQRPPTLRSDRAMRPLSLLLLVRASCGGCVGSLAAFARFRGDPATAAASSAATAAAAASPFSISALKDALYVGLPLPLLTLGVADLSCAGKMAPAGPWRIGGSASDGRPVCVQPTVLPSEAVKLPSIDTHMSDGVGGAKDKLGSGPGMCLWEV
jgi:hypothetical protein